MKAPELSAVYAAASQLVARVEGGRSLAALHVAKGGDGPMRAATMAVVYGTLRRYGRGPALLQALAHRGVPDPVVRGLMLCALYAIESGSYAEHVAVDQAVRACRVLGKPSAADFVNAMLRRFLRERAALQQRMETDPVARFMHPDWWIESVRRAHPGEWPAVLAAGNSRPPMGLRINRRRSSADEYLARLEKEGLRGQKAGQSAVLLETPVGVDRLPGFAEGEVSVQDIGAQRAADFLDLDNGQRVLDACAAPGGKAGHLLEIAEVDLLAIDSDASRCERIRENFARLGLDGRIQTADCARPENWWDGRPFDRVLADVPCTASGIARRHPDIKWLRRPGDPARFAEVQSQILGALWRVLAPGGKLLYVTCSVFPDENTAVVDEFCASQPAALRLDLPGHAPAQLLPGTGNDGFFFALVQKKS